MLNEYWYIAAESRELTAKKPLGRQLLGQKVVLWRDREGRAHAIADKCIHRGVPLSSGEMEGDCLRCRFHGWGYNGEGRVVIIPSNGPDAPVPARAHTRAYKVEEHGGYVWLYTGIGPTGGNRLPQLPEELTNPAWAVGRRYDDVESNYTRVNEQNIDIAHLPWVHRKTIGRGMPRDEPISRLMVPRAEGLSVYFDDAGPDWLRALRRPFENLKGPFGNSPQPMPLPDGLHFDMPNLFRIVKSGMIAGLYAVPLDEGNTRIYHYVARRWLKRVPLLSQLFLRVNLQIIREDMRILRIQMVKSIPEDINQEFHVRTDEPQLYYRKMRAAYFAAHPNERSSPAAQPQPPYNASAPDATTIGAQCRVPMFSDC